MAGRQQPNRGGGGGNNVRQNEYFVPRDGIDREVITADICRYLGNDALVRPGNYYQESSGRNIQGYYITAYRNLTTAMIADLKADSARWEQERRKLQSGAGRYADSAVRQMGGTSAYGGQSGGGYQASNRDYGGADTMQYPGSDAPGYSAGGGSVAGAAGAHYTTGYTNPAAGYSTAQQYQAPYATQTTDTRYTAGTAPGAPMVGGYVQETSWAPPVPYAVQGPHAVQQTRGQDYMDTPMSEAPSAPAARTPNQYTGPGVRQGYPGQAPTAYSYQAVPGTGPTAYSQQSGDAFFGRGGYSATTSAPQALSDSVASPAATTGYSAATGQEQQYDEQMAASARPTAAAAVPGTTTQIPPASGSSRRDRDRERGGERDRESHERQRDRDRDRDREREREHRQDRGDDGQRRKAHHYGR